MTASLSGGLLEIKGTVNNDAITISQRGSLVWVVHDEKKGSVGSHSELSFAAAKVANVRVYGYEGNDYISSFGLNFPVEARGGPGNDSIYGGLKGDVIYGQGDNDLLYGNEGDDVVSGGVGNDSLYGYTGNDTLYGDEGNDLLKGIDGIDSLYGYTGNDTLYGGYGDDYLKGHAGVDYLYGESGNDTFRRSLYVPGFGPTPEQQQDMDDENAKADVPEQVSGSFLTVAKQDDWAEARQQGSPTCAFLAVLSAVASKTGVSNDLVRAIRYDAVSETYSVPIWSNGSWRRNTLNGDWNESYDPNGALWVTLYQRAFLRSLNVTYLNSDGTYKPQSAWSSSTTGDDWKIGSVAFTALTGRTVTNGWNGSPSACTMLGVLGQGHLLVAVSKPTTNSGVVEKHSYWVRNVYFDNATRSYFIQLRNPWGKDGRAALPGDANFNDGLITLSFSTFKDNFQGYYWNYV